MEKIKAVDNVFNEILPKVSYSSANSVYLTVKINMLIKIFFTNNFGLYAGIRTWMKVVSRISCIFGTNKITTAITKCVILITHQLHRYHRYLLKYYLNRDNNYLDTYEKMCRNPVVPLDVCELYRSIVYGNDKEWGDALTYVVGLNLQEEYKNRQIRNGLDIRPLPSAQDLWR